MKIVISIVVVLCLWSCCSKENKCGGGSISENYYEGVVYLNATDNFKTGLIRCLPDPSISEIQGILYNYVENSSWVKNDTLFFKIQENLNDYFAVDITRKKPEKIANILNFGYMKINLHNLSNHGNENHWKGHIYPIVENGQQVLYQSSRKVFKLYSFIHENPTAVDTFWSTDTNIDSEMEFLYDEEVGVEIGNSLTGYCFEHAITPHVH